MSLSRHSLVTLATLALSATVAAHADTFSGTASFNDDGPAGNHLYYTGSFANPAFTFSGPVGTTYTDRLTITADQLNFGPTSDNINVDLAFTLPGSVNDSVNGNGYNYFVGIFEDNTIVWNQNTTLINFANGSQVSANLPDFTFSNFFLDSTAQGSENLTLTVTKTAVTPEPSSLALLGTGLVGACGALRRRLSH